MPNGGHICCDNCTYNRLRPGICDICGIETSPFLLCRAYRQPKQSHEQARAQWNILNKLEPGIVYEIDNSYPSTGGNPHPIYRMNKIG